MAKGSGSKRHPLLFYQHVLNVYSRPVSLLTTLLLALWFAVSYRLVSWPQPPADQWLLAGTASSLLAALFIWVGPMLAYVQPRPDHLRLSTPIFKLNISYRRVANTRPINLARMFPPSSLRSRQRRWLEPFYPLTALGVDLHGYPMPRWVMSLFLHPTFFAADQPGLVLIVEDWMALSSQLESRLGAWRLDRSRRPSEAGGSAQQVLYGEDQEE